MSDIFDHQPLQASVQRALELAQQEGATGAEVEASRGRGLNVVVRLGEIETAEYHRSKSLALTVFFDGQRASAHTSDFSNEAIAKTVRHACELARYGEKDKCAKLPDAALHPRTIPDLQLHRPWGLSIEEAVRLAKQCEESAFAVDSRIKNSEGASIATAEANFVYGNSNGFIAGFPTSRYDISCAVVAMDGNSMQRDYWHVARRDPTLLPPVEEIGQKAGERTKRRLGARKINTMAVPVLFEAPAAANLWRALVSAASGGALYRKASFLVNALHHPLLPDNISLKEDPHIPKALASVPFDGEGVATSPRFVVEKGILCGYFLSSYTACKLGMATTGNAGGAHNLLVESEKKPFEELVRQMGRGLVVTELMGHGVNLVSGDYSKGAVGFWVEDGVIAYPVEEITIAGNLKEMFARIIGLGSDEETFGAIHTGSVLIENMTIAGA